MSVNVNQVKSIGEYKFKMGSERITPFLPSTKSRNCEKEISTAESIIIVSKNSVLLLWLLKKVFSLISNPYIILIPYINHDYGRLVSILLQKRQSCPVWAPSLATVCVQLSLVSWSFNRPWEALEAPSFAGTHVRAELWFRVEIESCAWPKGTHCSMHYFSFFPFRVRHSLWQKNQRTESSGPVTKSFPL